MLYDKYQLNVKAMFAQIGYQFYIYLSYYHRTLNFKQINNCELTWQVNQKLGSFELWKYSSLYSPHQKEQVIVKQKALEIAGVYDI